MNKYYISTMIALGLMCTACSDLTATNPPTTQAAYDQQMQDQALRAYVGQRLLAMNHPTTPPTSHTICSPFGNQTRCETTYENFPTNS